jgi:uncharacterized protein YneF (UPF0154 family)
MDIIEIPIAAILVRLLAVLITLIAGRWLARHSQTHTAQNRKQHPQITPKCLQQKPGCRYTVSVSN